MPVIALRPVFNRVLSVSLWAIGTVAIGAVWAGPGTPRTGGVVVAAVGGALLVWAVLWSPRLVVDDDGVRVENILHVVTVPWPALIHVETQYALTLVTPRRRVRVTAAPAPGQLAAFRSTPARRRVERSAGETLRPGDLPHTDSGRAALVVRDRWDLLRHQGRIELGVADTTPVASELRVVPLVAIVAGAAALIAGALAL